MSGQNVVPLRPTRRSRSAAADRGSLAMLAFVIVEAMMGAGMLTAFLVTRAAAGGAWPPAGQPWFPPEEMGINTAALLASGAVVFRASRAWEKREVRLGPLLLAAIALGVFFLFFQGFLWITLIRRGLTLTSTQYGSFFCLIVGFHAANTLGALILMGLAWLRLKPLRDDGEPRGFRIHGAFSAARILWYFVVGAWLVLLPCHYL